MKFARSSMLLLVFLGVVLCPLSLLFAQGQEPAGSPSPASPAPQEAARSVRLPEPAKTVEQPALPPQGAETPPAKPGESPEAKPSPSDEMVYLNVQDQDIKDVIKQISKASGKNFIIDDKVRGKISIISEKMMTKEEAYQAFLSALEVAGFTTVTGPAGIIKIRPQKDAISSPIPIHVDSTPYTDSYVTRLISLKNISALDMSSAIKDLISKSGNMFAYPATNTLIITDSGTNIDRLMKIIKELDQEGPQQIIEIVPIRYADAKQIAGMVLNLFESEEGGAGGGARRGAAAQKRPQGGGELAEIRDVSNIIADERTNSLIVVASKRAISRVREIIGRLDTPLVTGDTGMIHVHPLKYANAKELAATLSSVTSGGSKASSRPGGPGGGAPGQGEQKTEEGSAVAKLEGGVTIGADETTNALIITASAKDYQVLVDELISKLDIPRRQVYLESMIMELVMRKQTDMGVRGFGGSAIGSMLGFGQTFAATGGLSGIFNQQGLVGGVIGRDSVSVSIPVVSGGTVTNQQVSIPAYAAFLNLLQVYSDANIVSSPNILTLDNQQAEINITSKIYANKVTTIATGVTTTEPTPLESGLILKLTPQVSEGNAVRLKIEQELSNFTGPPNESGAAPSTKRKVSTTVVTQDGQTVVLGGLMQDNVTHAKSKVPILGDIPLLGFLFRTSSSLTEKTNLLIFITPHVIRDTGDFGEVMKRKIEQRNRFIEDNYGAKQKRAIRDTLAIHRADLLEFVPGGSIPSAETTTPLPPSSGPQSPPPPPAVVRSSPLPPAGMPVPQGKPPVITVPSVDPQARSQQSGAPPPAVSPSAPPSSSSQRSTSTQGGVRPPPAPAGSTPGGPTDLDLAY